MTQALVLRQRQGRKSRRWDMKITCFFFFFFVVIFQIGLSSSSASVDSPRFVLSPPRKTLMYGTTRFRGPLNKEENIYGDDKRVVYTGPNPLHN
ncbi:hypothetical protein N665_3352s0001 [Sinapis alba]|nr:hypothetical protein N665_3352s0001 [Sinapis alba]